MMEWHNTKTLYTKILQVEHNFPEQVVLHPSGSGKGVVQVMEGCHNVHPCVQELCKQDFVYQVCVAKGYLMITVDQPRYWDRILGELTNIVARHM